MGYSKYVGRVGALALALGIGTAVATPAWAESPNSDTESSSTETKASRKAPSNKPSVAAGNVTHESSSDEAGENVESADDSEATGPKEDAGLEDESVEEVIVEEEEVLEAILDDDDVAASTTESPIQTSPDPEAEPSLDEVLDTADVEPEPVAAQRTSALPETRPVTSARTYALPTNPPPGVPAPAPLVQQPKTPVGLILGGPVALLDITSKAINMLFNPDPSVPGDPPLLLGVLVFVRREIQRTFFNSSPDAIADIASTSEGVPTRITVLGNDIDPNIGDILTITNYTQSANGVVALNSDGSFTYTPKAGFSGTDTFTYTISDDASPWHSHGLVSLLSSHNSTATVTVTVAAAPINQKPTAGADSVSVAEDGSTVINVLANDTDPDEDSLAIIAVSTPTHGTATITDGKVTYTAGANYHGTDTFTYTISDGALTATATVTVTVTSVNDVPVAVNDAVTVAANSGTTSINVLANDTDPDAGTTLSVTVVGAPNQGGTASINADKTVAYRPAAGFSGTETFTYAISDGTATTTATVTVTVTPPIPVNAPPVATDDAVVMPAGSASMTVNVVSNDTDPDNDALSVVGVTGVTNGTATFTGGTITYTPTTGYSGVQVLTYTVSDGTLTDTATLTITVPAVNRAPVATDNTVTMPTGSTFTVVNVLTDDTDPDNDALTLTAVTGVQYGTVVFNSAGSITYTPTTGPRPTRTEVLTYTITDGTLTDTATLTITVPAIAPNQAPVATDNTVTMPAGSTYTVVNVLGDDTDPDNDALTLTAVTGVQYGTVVFNSAGSITYTPTTGPRPTRTEVLTYTITDGTLTDTATLTITVPAVNRAPVASNDSVTMPAGASSVTVNVVTNDTDPDGNTLSVVGVTGVTNGAATFTGGSITYAPTPGYSGTQVLTYTVSDGTLTDTATLTITVPAVVVDNHAPVAGEPAYEYTTNHGSGIISGTLDVTDEDGDELTYTVTGLPGADVGILAIDPESGAWQFKPTNQARFQAWRNPGAAVASFAITVSDGEDSVTVNVAAQISPAFVFDEDWSDPGVEGARSVVVLGSDGSIFFDNADGLSVVGSDGSVRDPILLGFRPTDAVFGTDGRLYLTDPMTDSISILDLETGSVAQFASVPKPSGIAFDDDGRLLVASAEARTITVIDADGSIANVINLDAMPTDVVVGADGRIYVAEITNDRNTVRLTVRNADGSVAAVLYEEISTPLGHFAAPLGLALGPHGAIFLVDSNHGELTAFTPDGQRMNTAWVEGMTRGVAVDADGRVLVVSALDNSLVVLTPVAQGSDDEYGYTIDWDTNVVSGELYILNPGGQLTFELTAGPPAALGTVTVDEATGAWIFTPSDEARAAAAYGEYDWSHDYVQNVDFLITASDGTQVVVTAPIFGNVEYDVDVLEVVGGTPTALAIGVDGRIYVANRDAKTITVLSTNGDVVTTIELDFAPDHVVTTGTGYVIVTNGIDDTVTVIANSGGVLAEPTSESLGVGAVLGAIAIAQEDDSFVMAVAGTDSVSVYRNLNNLEFVLDVPSPTGMVFGSDGEIYIVGVDQEGAGYLKVFDGDGNLLTTTLLGGNPSGIAMGPNDHLYISDRNGLPRDVAIADVYGWADSWLDLGVSGAAVAVAADGRVYIADPDTGTVTVLTPPNAPPMHTPVGTVSTVETSGIANLYGIAVAPDGRIIVTGMDTATFGDFVLGTVGADGTFTGLAELPGTAISVEIGPDNRIYVSDFEAGTVTAYDPAKEFASEVIATVPGAAALAFDGAGNLYVTSTEIGSGSGISATSSLHIITPSGSTKVVALPGVSYDVQVAADGRVFVPYFVYSSSVSAAGGVLVLNTDGTTVDIDLTPGITPAGIAIGRDGTLFITSPPLTPGNASGTLMVRYPNGLTRAIELGRQPFGIDFDIEGRLLITDPLSNTITVLDPIYDAVNAHAPTVFDDPDSRFTTVSGVVGGTVIGADADGDLLSYSIVSELDPTVGDVVVGPLTGAWHFTPTAQAQLTAWQAHISNPSAEPPSVTFTVAVTDGQAHHTVDITVEIIPATQPTAQDPAFSITSTDSLAGTITGAISVVDADGDELTYALAEDFDWNAGNAYVDYLTGNWEFTPSAELRGMAASGGTDQFTFTVNVTDGMTTVSVAITVPVVSNATPQVDEPAYSVTFTEASTGIVQGEVHVTDADGHTLTYSLGTGVDHAIGSISVDYSTGTWTFTPTDLARYNAWADAAAATATFSIRASDNWAVAEVTVIVDIAPGIGPSVLQELAASGAVLVSDNGDGTVRAIHGTFIPKPVGSTADAVEVFNLIAPLLGAAPGFAMADRVTVQRVPGTDDASGEVFYRLKPTLGGVVALGSTITLVVDGTGSVSGVFSSYSRGLNTVDLSPSADFSSEESAVAAARAHLRAQVGGSATAEVIDAFLDSIAFEGELAIYDLDSSISPRLVWRVRAASIMQAVDETNEYTPLGGEEVIVIPVIDGTYFIGANGLEAGQVLSVISAVEGATITRENAADLFGITRSFNAIQSGGKISLIDQARKLTVFVIAYRQDTLQSGAKVLYTSYKVASREQGQWDPEAVSAHHNITHVYNYYSNVLDHRGIDGDGAADINVYVNHDGEFSEWNGSRFRFSGLMLTARALDVVAHEYTHAVIQYVLDPSLETYGLIYNGESGAVNEAFADILGSLIENKPRSDPGRWLIREDSLRTIRSMQTPADFGQPEHYDDYDHNGTADDEEMHLYSGILNHAAYRMIMDPSEGSWRGSSRTNDIDDEEWAQVFFSALHRLPSNATFVDVRSAVISSAKVRGFTQSEVEAVQDAFDHVGIRATTYQYGVYKATHLGSSPLDLAFGSEKGRAYVITQDGTVKVIDTAALSTSGGDTYTPITVDIGGTPGDVAVAADGWLALVTNPTGDQVAIIDTKVIENVSVERPGKIAVSKNGLVAYVTSEGRNQVTIIDLTTGINPLTIKVPLCATCETQADIVVSEDGSRAFVTHPGSDTVSVITYAGQGTTPSVESVYVPAPHTIATSANGSIAAVYGWGGRVFIIDASGPQPSAATVPAYFNSYRSTGFLAVSGNGKRAWVTNHSEYSSVVALDITDPAAPAVLWRQSLFDLPHSVATTFDGTRAYVVAHDHFWVLDTRSGQLKASAANMPPNITFNSGSDYQQVAVSGRGDVAVATSIDGHFVVLNASAF